MLNLSNKVIQQKIKNIDRDSFIAAINKYEGRLYGLNDFVKTKFLSLISDDRIELAFLDSITRTSDYIYMKRHNCPPIPKRGWIFYIPVICNNITVTIRYIEPSSFFEESNANNRFIELVITEINEDIIKADTVNSQELICQTGMNQKNNMNNKSIENLIKNIVDNIDQYKFIKSINAFRGGYEKLPKFLRNKFLSILHDKDLTVKTFSKIKKNTKVICYGFTQCPYTIEKTIKCKYVTVGIKYNESTKYIEISISDIDEEDYIFQFLFPGSQRNRPKSNFSPFSTKVSAYFNTISPYLRQEIKV